MRWFGFAALLVVAACTADNPDFDGEVGPTPMQGTDGEAGGSTSSPPPTSGLVTTDSASAATTSDEGVDTGSSGGDPSATGGSESSGSNACVDEPDGRFKITVFDNGTQILAACEDFEIYGDVFVDPDGGSLQVADCGGECPCAKQASIYEVGFGDKGAVPDVYGGCRRVVVWSPADEGGCEWTGFSIEPYAGPPFVIGSNRLVAGLAALGEGPSFGDGEECGLRGCDGGTPHPGHYALALDGVEVWPDDPATEVMIGDTAYMFDNRMSFVSDTCEEKVAWWAEIR